MANWCVGCKAQGILELAQVVESTDFGDLPLCHHCKMAYDTMQLITQITKDMEKMSTEMAAAVITLSQQVATLTAEVYESRARIDALEQRFAGNN